MDLLSDIIETPKISPIKFRIGAAAIDFFSIYAFAWGLAWLWGDIRTTTNSAQFNLSAVPSLIWFFGSFGLISLQEGLTGKTLGKRLTGIKVVRRDTLEPSLSASIIRHLFDIIDITFCIGFIIAALNEKRQRIGDKIARTIVVIG
jgi:uncharacterized RDD family membrane protein YckC